MIDDRQLLQIVKKCPIRESRGSLCNF